MIARRRRTRDQYLRVFDNPDGRLVLEHLMKVGFVFNPTYVAGDPTETAHREGMRRIVMSILRMVKIDDKKLMEMFENENEPD